jgi:hypothetical protein
VSEAARRISGPAPTHFAILEIRRDHRAYSVFVRKNDFGGLMFDRSCKFGAAAEAAVWMLFEKIPVVCTCRHLITL